MNITINAKLSTHRPGAVANRVALEADPDENPIVGSKYSFDL